MIHLPMPVASSIIRGLPVSDQMAAYGIDREKSVVAGASDAVKVDAQPACDMFWARNSYFDDRNDYPPTRLPYPALWLEWTHCHPKVGVPIKFFALLRSSSTEPWSAAKTGKDVEGWDCFNNERIREVISILGGVLQDDGTTNVWPLEVLALVDADGQLIENKRGTPLLVIGSESSSELLTELGSNLGKPALLAIGLMNTKNVDVVRESTSGLSRKELRRTKTPRFEYHVIKLPTPRGGSAASGATQQELAQHLVRGHFKTYTEDAPLMGKYTGTYWWAHQVRGNPAAGKIVSDYQLSGGGVS